MRVYLPLELGELEVLAAGGRLSIDSRPGVAVTAEFAVTVESEEPDELDLIAALAASDLPGAAAVGVIECEAPVVDAELGEVSVTSQAGAFDFECFLLGEVESQDASWFGVQELDSLLSSLRARP